MPPRLSVLIEGEGLLNDATALTTYQVAVAAAVGSGFSWAVASGRFVLAVVGGLAVGAAPFLTYLLAEAIHSSGILAVVVAGLMVGHDAGRDETGACCCSAPTSWCW